jgi:hemoglobin-like flavoprotein
LHIFKTEESNGHITAAAIKTKLRSILNLNVHKSTVQRVRHKYLGIEILSFFKQYTIVNIKLLLRV